MCLITRQKKAIVTTADMIVYKVVSTSLSSIYYKFQWEVGVVYQQKLSIGSFIVNHTKCYDDLVEEVYKLVFSVRKTYGDLIVINEGFHSFISTLRTIGTLWVDRKLVRCLIPAGSEVFFDETGLVVSNKLMILADEN